MPSAEVPMSCKRIVGVCHVAHPMLRNTISTYHRSAYNRRRTKLDDHSFERQAWAESSPEDELHERRQWMRVSGAIHELDDIQRRIVILHDLDESAMSRVAEAVGCPLQTAYSRLRAAHKTMRTRCRAV